MFRNRSDTLCVHYTHEMREILDPADTCALMYVYHMGLIGICPHGTSLYLCLFRAARHSRPRLFRTNLDFHDLPLPGPRTPGVYYFNTFRTATTRHASMPIPNTSWTTCFPLHLICNTFRCALHYFWILCNIYTDTV